jgi:hypothetical protein
VNVAKKKIKHTTGEKTLLPPGRFRKTEWTIRRHVGPYKGALANPGYEAECSCGVVRVVSHENLVRGLSQSCGHRRVQAIRESFQKNPWIPPNGYSPPREEQLKVTWKGETLTYTEWEERTGLPAGLLRSRIRKLGWTPERALTTPHRDRLVWLGQVGRTLAGWARLLGVSRSLVHLRIKQADERGEDAAAAVRLLAKEVGARLPRR